MRADSNAERDRKVLGFKWVSGITVASAHSKAHKVPPFGKGGRGDLNELGHGFLQTEQSPETFGKAPKGRGGMRDTRRKRGGAFA